MVDSLTCRRSLPRIILNIIPLYMSTQYNIKHHDFIEDDFTDKSYKKDNKMKRNNRMTSFSDLDFDESVYNIDLRQFVEDF